MRDDGLIEPPDFCRAFARSFYQAYIIDNFGKQSGEGISIAARSPLRLSSVTLTLIERRVRRSHAGREVRPVKLPLYLERRAFA